MEITRLLQMRKLFPGILILLLLLPLYFFYTQEIKSPSKEASWFIKLAFLGIAVVVGSIYNGLRIREKFNKEDYLLITRNITGRLKIITEKYNKKNAITNKAIRIEPKTYMQIFYSILDSDDSLKEKSKIVKSNGLIWSSSVDFVVISTPFIIVYLALSYTAYYLENDGFCLLLIAYSLLILLSLCEFFFRSRVLKKHIDLSNNQIDYIEANLSHKLAEKINDANQQ